MKLLPSLLSACTILPVASARDLVPEHWLENVPASDDSVQKSLVFRTIAGVAYRVESSGNLTDWTGGAEIYGLGHEFVVPLFEFTPPPPPDPGDPPAEPFIPFTHITVRMQTSSATPDDTVVSWKSLDHGGPMVALIEGEMHPDWQTIPLFAERYDNHYFFVWHPGGTIGPPAENPPLGPKDDAMIATLENHLDDMNATVMTSAARVRNSPPPAPPASGSRQFWRIHADWTVDTDGDGTPDWAEFAMAAESSHPSHGLADAFNADADNDGQTDELDTDNDGIADNHDADLDSDAVDWEKAGSPRFAWFTFSPPDDPWGYSQSALQVTDAGQVVFPFGLWSAGTYAAVARSGAGVENCTILAMGGPFGGQLVGAGSFDSDDDGFAELACHVMWFNGVPQPVKSGDTFATSRFSGITNPSAFLGKDGGFIAGARNASGVIEGTFRWVLPVIGNEASYGVAPDWAESGLNSNLLWGQQQARIWGADTTLPGFYRNLVATPGGSIIACGVYGSPAVFRDDAWKVESSFPDLVDFSNQGFGVTTSPVTVWSDGRAVPLETSAPGLPAGWKQGTRFFDFSDGGNLLDGRETASIQGPEEYALAVPFVLQDDVEASGVDAVSVTSTSPGPGIDNKLWVMAPAGGENKVRFKTTAAGLLSLDISAAPATFDPAALGVPDQLVTVGAAAGSDSGDHDLVIFNGTSQSVTTPVGVKVMKKRTVRVSVYPVVLDILGEGIGERTPDFELGLGTDGENVLGTALTRVFEDQVAARFLVKKEDPITINWDTNNDLIFQASSFDESPDQLKVLENSPESTFEPHIRVFVIGSHQPSLDHPKRGLLSGINHATAQPNKRVVWISGSSRDGTRTQARFEHTLVHEIGHVLMDWDRLDDPGYGHPDDDGGVAPLPGTDRTRRLMVSGPRQGPTPGHLLVKTEWDRIEEWMKSDVDGE